MCKYFLEKKRTEEEKKLHMILPSKSYLGFSFLQLRKKLN